MYCESFDLLSHVMTNLIQHFLIIMLKVYLICTNLCRPPPWWYTIIEKLSLKIRYMFFNNTFMLLCNKNKLIQIFVQNNYKHL